MIGPAGAVHPSASGRPYRSVGSGPPQKLLASITPPHRQSTSLLQAPVSHFCPCVSENVGTRGALDAKDSFPTSAPRQHPIVTPFVEGSR